MMFGKTTVPTLAALAILLAWGAPAAVAQTPPQPEEPLRVAIVRTDVINSRLGPNEPPVENMTDQLLVSLFERAGYETRLIDSPAPLPAGWASDRQLSQAAQQVEADWVVYPRILVIGGVPIPPEPVEEPLVAHQPQTEGIFYIRVVDVRRPLHPATVYMRQVGHPWPHPPVQIAAFGEAEAVPFGFARTLQYFQPLNSALIARGEPSLTEEPLALAQTVWPQERVAGFRDTIRDR